MYVCSPLRRETFLLFFSRLRKTTEATTTPAAKEATATNVILLSRLLLVPTMSALIAEVDFEL